MIIDHSWCQNYDDIDDSDDDQINVMACLFEDIKRQRSNIDDNFDSNDAYDDDTNNNNDDDD